MDRDVKIFPGMKWVIGLMIIWIMSITVARATDHDTTTDHQIPSIFHDLTESDVSDVSGDEKVNRDNKNYRDFRHCFNGYRGWVSPRDMNIDLLEGLCQYIEFQKVRYIHHSDLREKSLHPSGNALDFRFAVPHGVDPVLFYREHTIGLWYYLVATGRYQWGMGLYLDTANFFWQIDTGEGERANRRWARLNGQYVSFGRGIDELIRLSRQR